jgi:type I restriction enzyme, S subunit
MSFPRYPAYKPSGVEWLGEVPEHWQVKPLKTITSINDEVLPESLSPDYEIEYVDIGSVSLANGIEKTEAMPFGDAPSRARRIPRDGDVLVSTIRTYLKAVAPVVNPPSNLVASTGFAVVRPRHELEPEFLKYALQEEHFIQQLISRSTGVSYPAINASDVAKISLNLPCSSEQLAIAAFLSHETAKIDDLIAEQQRLIELLQEKRQAVISHAVTKGLNPDAPMKDSGVEWLGEVPVHWVVCNFQRFVQIAEGQVDPRQNPYADMPLIAPNHIQAGTGQLLGLETAAEQGAESGKYICNEGDVIYSKIRPSLRKACIAPCACLTSADMYPLRAHGRLSNEFLFRFLLSEQFSALAIVESERVAMPKINRDSLKSVALAIPPKLEQEDICLSIRVHSRTFDALIAEGQEAIVLLSERRSALISAAVTGQIDVRGLVLEGEAA